MSTREFAFENGTAVKEVVTGFTGVITGTCFYLTGCTQYLITAESKDGKEPVALWYDEGRIELDTTKASFSMGNSENAEKGCDVAPSQGRRGV